MKYVLVAGVVIVGISAAGVMPTGREHVDPFPGAPAREVWPGTAVRVPGLRHEILRRARVWHATDAAVGDLSANPPDLDGALSGSLVRCRFISTAARGTTTKFDCVLATGERVTVKYGHTGEIPAELAATRLFTALGFATDRMYLVPRLRCYGCPRQPFYTAWLLDRVHARDVALAAMPSDTYTDFEWVNVERRLPGVEVEAADGEGWAWYEFAALDTERERATTDANESRAHRDALRLAAIFIAHWDNKPSNQRLVCSTLKPAGAGVGVHDAGRCERPVAYLQDLGASFGPNKIDVNGWRRAPVWADATACRVSMRAFPFGGGTFRDVSISEAGRRLLAERLTALTRDQVHQLFAGARVREFYGGGASADVDTWTDVFLAKATAIAAAGPCPLAD